MANIMCTLSYAESWSEKNKNDMSLKWGIAWGCGPVGGRRVKGECEGGINTIKVLNMLV
jgi:hypothetical protein